MSGSKAKELRKELKTASRDIMESTILVKLYEDGFIRVDEEKLTAVFDCRMSSLAARYGESSYKDVMDIMKRTAVGLDIAGYSVDIRYIDSVDDTEGGDGE